MIFVVSAVQRQYDLLCDLSIYTILPCCICHVTTESTWFCATVSAMWPQQHNLPHSACSFSLWTDLSANQKASCVSFVHVPFFLEHPCSGWILPILYMSVEMSSPWRQFPDHIVFLSYQVIFLSWLSPQLQSIIINNLSIYHTVWLRVDTTKIWQRNEESPTTVCSH